MTCELSIHGVPGIAEIRAGTALAPMILAAVQTMGITLTSRDVLVLAQKIVSKSEGRVVDLLKIEPGREAREIAGICRKDPRLVEVILSEAAALIRVAPHVLIVRHRLGHVMANAGVDQSNLPAVAGEERVLLLPIDPDLSARRLRDEIERLSSISPGVIISDSFGRPWRLGTTNVAIGVAGIAPLWDRRGELDREGRTLEMTQVAVADAIAGAAGLAMGEVTEGTPLVVVRGFECPAATATATALLRPPEEDLFS